MEDIKKPWQLYTGCHRRTFTSRDSAVDECDSLEECKEAVKRKEQSWANIGYYVWYAYAIGPDNKRVDLHQGTSYS